MNPCGACGEPISIAGRGRIRSYCTTRCRVAAHRAKSAPPTELTSRPRWVRYSKRKAPLTVHGTPASSTNPTTWTTYAAARRSTAGAGLGLVLNGDGLVCIDIDHCLTDTGVADWAQAILDRCPPTFTEISPSGDGLHLWGRADVLKGRRIRVPGGTVEIYGAGRFITVTGRRHGDSPKILADLSDVIAHLTT